MPDTTTSPKLSRNVLAHLLMFATVMLWGAMFVLVKEAILRIEPQWFNASRMILAFACLAILYRNQWRQLTRAAWLAGAAAGAALAGGFFFQTQGLLYTSATNSAFLTALVVVLVPLMTSLPGLRTPGKGLPKWTAWTGALLAFAGVALLTTPSHTPWAHVLGSLNRGDLLTLVCAVAMAFQIMALDHGTKKVRFEQLAMLQIGFSMVFLTIAAFVTEPPHPGAIRLLFSSASPLANPFVLFAIAVAGFLATAMAFTIQTWAQQVIPATNIAIILTLEPVFAWVTAFLVLHEGMQLRRGMGALLVLAGILAAEVLPRIPQAVRGKAN